MPQAVYAVIQILLKLQWYAAAYFACLNPSQEGNHSESNLTWDDRALNSKSSAVLSELDELLHIIEQLSDDDLCTCLNLHTWQYEHTNHLHSKDSICPQQSRDCFILLLPRLRLKTEIQKIISLSACNGRASTRLALA